MATRQARANVPSRFLPERPFDGSGGFANGCQGGGAVVGDGTPGLRGDRRGQVQARPGGGRVAVGRTVRDMRR